MWHRDIVESSIHQVPLHVQHVNLNSRNPTKLDQLVIPPIAPSLVLPHVLDTPRTQLRKIEMANALLANLPSGDSLQLPNSNQLLLENETAYSGKHRHLSNSIEDSTSNDDGSGGRLVKHHAVQGGGGPTSAVIALLNKKEDTSLLDAKGVIRDKKLPGMTATACYPWMLMKHTDRVTGKEVTLLNLEFRFVSGARIFVLYVFKLVHELNFIFKIYCVLLRWSFITMLRRIEANGILHLKAHCGSASWHCSNN
jgi:hypothetical protein